MASTESQIIRDISGNPVTVTDNRLDVNVDSDAAQDTTIQDLYNQLGLLLDRLEYGNITDNKKQLKVNLVDSGVLPGVTTVTTVSTVSTVTTVGTVSSVTNTVRQGDMQMQRVNEALLDSAFINGILNNVSF